VRAADDVLGLAIDTLARGKHILALTWDRVDFDRRIVWYAPHRPGAKKKTQAAPMTGRLYALLKLAEAASARDEEGALLCPRVISWNDKPVKSVRKAYERAVRLASIEDAHRHDLRRSGAPGRSKEV
jgi:integrase